jgi:peptidoglycan/LPS O-acetylase OafA/YrhL
MSSGEIVPPSPAGNVSESRRESGSAAPVSYAFVDALRGVAALLVVLFHQQIHVFLDYPTKPIPPGSFSWWVFLGFFDMGKYAVVVFFMVSGFLIPATLRRPGANLKQFVRHRFFRLYPAYWFSIVFRLASLAAMGSLAGVDWKLVAVNLTMLQKFVGKPDFIGVFWTLQIELTFYVICAALFRFGKLDRRVAAQAVSLGAAVVCAALRWQTGKPLPVALFLALVVMFAGDSLRCHGEGRADIREVRRVLATAVLGVVPVAWMGYGDDAQRYVLTYWAAIATFVACWRKADWFGLETVWKRVFGFLGEISYGMYVLGSTVLGFAGHWLYEPTGNAWLTAAVVLSGSTLAAWFSYRWIEKPAIALGRRAAVATDR